MKVLVAGGTGFLGRHITRGLVEDGHDVTVLGRDPARAREIPELGGADAISGDVTDAHTLRGKLDGAEAVVNAVQFPNHPVEVPGKGLTYDRFDRAGTENLVAEAQRAKVGHFLYLSGAGADPRSDRTWYRAKGLAEEAIKRSGLRYTILRPSWAYGSGDRALNRLAKIARLSPVVPRLGLAPQRIQPVHADDVALAFRRSLERQGAWNKTFEIGGPEMTMDSVLRTLCDVMGIRRPIVPIPVGLAKLVTAPLALLPRPPMTPQGIDFAVQDGPVDTAELEQILGVRPVSLEEGLSRYMAPKKSSRRNASAAARAQTKDTKH